MKKNLLLTFVFICFSLIAFADNEKLSVGQTDPVTGDYWLYNSNALPIQDPCKSLAFKIEYTVPSGYSVISYSWYVNNILFATQTDINKTSQSISVINNSQNNIVCKVTYKNNTTNALVINSSAAFPVIGKTLSVGINQQQPAILGCTNPVTFNTTTSTSQFTYTPAYYSVSWTPPSGWSATSIGANGQTATFTPAATSAGNINAAITLPQLGCGTYVYQTVSLPVTRTTPAPDFNVSSNVFNVCAGSATKTFSINGVCGATSYTYSIQGNTGCVFTSNSQQSVTVNSTSVSINFPQTGSYTVTLTVKANFSTGASSSTTSATIYFGATPPTNLQIRSSDCPEFNFTCDYLPNDVYHWSYYDIAKHVETPVTGFTSGVAKIVFPANGNYNVGVYETNSCGTSSVTFIPVTYSCVSGGGTHGIAKDVISIYPNPAAKIINISINENENASVNKIIKNIALYNSNGKLVLSKVVNVNTKSKKNFTIELPNLPSGIYFVKLFDGVNTLSKSIFISK